MSGLLLAGLVAEQSHGEAIGGVDIRGEESRLSRPRRVPQLASDPPRQAAVQGAGATVQIAELKIDTTFLHSSGIWIWNVAEGS